MPSSTPQTTEHDPQDNGWDASPAKLCVTNVSSTIGQTHRIECASNDRLHKVAANITSPDPKRQASKHRITDSGKTRTLNQIRKPTTTKSTSPSCPMRACDHPSRYLEHVSMHRRCRSTQLVQLCSARPSDKSVDTPTGEPSGHLRRSLRGSRTPHHLHQSQSAECSKEAEFAWVTCQ